MKFSGFDRLPTLLSSYHVQCAKVVLISSSDICTTFVLVVLQLGCIQSTDTNSSEFVATCQWDEILLACRILLLLLNLSIHSTLSKLSIHVCAPSFSLSSWNKLWFQQHAWLREEQRLLFHEADLCLLKHFPSACEKMVETVKKMVFQGKRRNSVLWYCIFYGTWIGLDA